MKRALVILVAVAALGGCDHPAVPYVWQLPEGLVPPVVPDENPMSVEKVALGRHLFYDKRLSGNGTLACGGCHLQSLGFTDGKATPTGSTGKALSRSSMMLGDAAYNDHYAWANPLLDTLEEQMLVPMFGDAPIELGMTNHVDEILLRLKSDPLYGKLFSDAFPSDWDPFVLANIVRALACFERTMIAGQAPFDRDQNGDPTALSASAQRGKTAFFQEKLDCYHCHAQPTFSSGFRTTNTPVSPLGFRNNAIYNLDGAGAYPVGNRGLYEFTGLPSDMGRFRAPSLRNIALTAPYFHDGSAATLDDVIDSYARGGRLIASGPNAGDGSKNPNRDPLVKGFSITDAERADLKAFLESLTDEVMLTDPAHSDPFQ